MTKTDEEVITLKLNIDKFGDDCKCISIGKLSSKHIDLIIQNRPDLADVLKNNNILMWSNRLEHIEKHRSNFQYGDFEKYIEDIPNIIKEPDYIGIPPHDLSIQFVKGYADNVLVAVRISTDGKLSFRTMYPITDSQLEDYKRKNRIWEVGND